MVHSLGLRALFSNCLGSNSISATYSVILSKISKFSEFYLPRGVDVRIAWHNYLKGLKKSSKLKSLSMICSVMLVIMTLNRL